MRPLDDKINAIKQLSIFSLNALSIFYIQVFVNFFFLFYFRSKDFRLTTEKVNLVIVDQRKAFSSHGSATSCFMLFPSNLLLQTLEGEIT